MIKVNGEKVELEIFPNGETLVKTEVLKEVKEPIEVEFKWNKDEDLLHLYFVLEHLKDLRKTDFNLVIYYMPYSRMDRSQNDNCFTLKHVCTLLKSSIRSMMNKISIYEPHSDVTLDLLDAERINIISPLMNEILKRHPEIDVICYPDKGAKNRFQDDLVKLPVVFCNKVRDFDTGEIKGLELDGDIDVKDKNILILDDLCSKGGTFYHTANKLKEAGAKDVYLGVCHMEPTVRYGSIYKYKDEATKRIIPIKHIYCMDTMLSETEAFWLQENSENLTIFSAEYFSKIGSFKEVE